MINIPAINSMARKRRRDNYILVIQLHSSGSNEVIADVPLDEHAVAEFACGCISKQASTLLKKNEMKKLKYEMVQNKENMNNSMK
jgi:hypothetical protein